MNELGTYNPRMVTKILLVEDDAGLQQYLQELLLDNGFSTDLAESGTTALKALDKKKPDLILLDLGLPDIDGETVCREARKKLPDVPVIILTARDSVNDVVHGLNLGADDYVTKPFVADELLARINARLRKSNQSEAVLTVGDLELNKSTMEVNRGDKPITLTPTEFKLLEYLMSNKARILTREMILNRVWLYSEDVETRVVDVYMGYLRKKVDADHEKKLIQSVRGFGYTIKD